MKVIVHTLDITMEYIKWSHKIIPSNKNYRETKYTMKVPMIKKYCKDNISIKISDFKLKDTSFYGCDATFEFEIIDKETGTHLADDVEIIDSAFMGIDDSEDIYNFLEEKGIDFSEEYDDNFDSLPEELKKEYEEYELVTYNDMYHDWFFEAEEDEKKEIIDRIFKETHLEKGLFYVIKDGAVNWIGAKADYFGVHLHSDTLDIHKVYNINMEDGIYELDGEFFDIVADNYVDWEKTDYTILHFKRDEDHPYIVSSGDLRNDRYIGYRGKAGDVIYNYLEVL